MDTTKRDDPRQTVANNLNELLEKSGKTRAQVARDLGVSDTTISYWFNGKKYPRIEKIQLLADYFGVYRSRITGLRPLTDEDVREFYKTSINMSEEEWRGIHENSPKPSREEQEAIEKQFQKDREAEDFLDEVLLIEEYSSEEAALVDSALIVGEEFDLEERLESYLLIRDIYYKSSDEEREKIINAANKILKVQIKQGADGKKFTEFLNLLSDQNIKHQFIMSWKKFLKSGQEDLRFESIFEQLNDDSFRQLRNQIVHGNL